MADKLRVRIFVDFWNFQLQWNDAHTRAAAGELVQIPWKDLPTVLVAEALIGQAAKFAGIHVYASIDPQNEKDKKLNKWLHHVLASFPGYAVEVKERRPRAPVKCSNEDCREPVRECPKCKEPIKATVEKGIDAAIITDMLSMAFDDNYDVAILISGDADYAPAVQYIQKKTDKQIVQAFFKAHGDQLRTACWSHIFFEDLFSKLDLKAVQKSPTAEATTAVRMPVGIPKKTDKA